MEKTAHKKPHISQSALKTYMRCPMQWYYRYIEEVPAPLKIEMALGSAVHKALEHNFRQKIESGSDLSVDEVQERFSSSFVKSSENLPPADKKKVGKFKDQGAELISLYMENSAPEIQPAMVEQEVRLPFNQDVDFLGYIDLVDSKGLLIDFKVSKKRINAFSVEADLQLSAYAWAYRVLTGRQESGVAIDQMLNTKTPDVERITSRRTDEHLLRFIRITENVLKSIRLGIFYPVDNPMICSWCPYSEVCRPNGNKKK